MTYKKGDKIKCVSVGASEYLEVGKVYTIKYIQCDESAFGGQGLMLVELETNMYSSLCFQMEEEY